jgi:hypothetical protein
MLSKCAIPSVLKYLDFVHQGKAFASLPVPQLQMVRGSLLERFWLCEPMLEGDDTDRGSAGKTGAPARKHKKDGRLRQFVP